MIVQTVPKSWMISNQRSSSMLAANWLWLGAISFKETKTSLCGKTPSRFTSSVLKTLGLWLVWVPRVNQLKFSVRLDLQTTFMLHVNEKFLSLENLILNWKNKSFLSTSLFTWMKMARRQSLDAVKVRSTTSYLTLWRRQERSSNSNLTLVSACLAETRRSSHLSTRKEI